MNRKNLYLIHEACERTGLLQTFVYHCIEAEWVKPADPEAGRLDEEDIARLSLIHELQADLGVNEEAIPIILHLMDQLYAIRARLAARRSKAA